jgi:hypothetical protein
MFPSTVLFFAHPDTDRTSDAFTDTGANDGPSVSHR